MAYDSSFGGDPHGGWCKACRKPIEDAQPVVRIDFPATSGAADMNGLYHATCSKPYSSLAHALSMLSRPWL
jgi:hypothetical protein